PSYHEPTCVFLNSASTTKISTLSLHDALPISDVHLRASRVEPQVRGEARALGNHVRLREHRRAAPRSRDGRAHGAEAAAGEGARSEEHTSELQSPDQLVCRLRLEKKNIEAGTT